MAVGSNKDGVRKGFIDKSATETQYRTLIDNSLSQAIPVFITDSANSDDQSNYGSITSVPTSTLSTIVSLTVPAGKTFLLKEIEVGGSNVATYTVEISSTIEAKKRTYFNYFNERFNWHGLEVAAGATINVKVIHSRSPVADFEARIIGAEI